MLVLSRKKNERIVLGGMDGMPLVTVVVVDIRGDKVRLGFEAPKSVPVHRLEIFETIERNRRREGGSGEDFEPVTQEEPRRDMMKKTTLEFRELQALQNELREALQKSVVDYCGRFSPELRGQIGMALSLEMMMFGGVSLAALCGAKTTQEAIAPIRGVRDEYVAMASRHGIESIGDF